jgi:hypothetical protein
MAKDGNTKAIDMRRYFPQLDHSAQALVLETQFEEFRVSRSQDHIAPPIALWSGVRTGAEWSVREASNHSELARLLPLKTTEGLSVTLLDPELNSLGSVFARTGDDTTTERGRKPNRDVAVVRDHDGRSTHVVRSDGPTGLHIVDATGAVVVFASRGDDPDVLDVLVLPAVLDSRSEQQTDAGFAAVTALCVCELLRVGALVAR